MSRRVATITLNPAYDLVGFTPEIERGEVNLVKTTGLHAAGKGINVAKVLKDLGIDVTVGGFLGRDNQDGFQQLFSELGIANRFQVVSGRTRINVKLTEQDGEVTDFNFRVLKSPEKTGNVLPATPLLGWGSSIWSASAVACHKGSQRRRLLSG